MTEQPAGSKAIAAAVAPPPAAMTEQPAGSKAIAAAVAPPPTCSHDRTTSWKHSSGTNGSRTS